MTEEDLDKLEAKAKWSGWDREDSKKIILDLIGELRSRPASLPLVESQVEYSKAPNFTDEEAAAIQKEVEELSRTYDRETINKMHGIPNFS